MAKKKTELRLSRIEFDERMVLNGRPKQALQPGEGGWDIMVEGPIVSLFHSDKGTTIEVPRSRCIITYDRVEVESKRATPSPAKPDNTQPPSEGQKEDSQ